MPLVFARELSQSCDNCPARPQSGVIVLSKISKAYGERIILHPLSLEVPNQTTAVIGPSGCIKSTLLRMVLGLIASDTGSVDIGGTRLTAANSRQSRPGIGSVIQDGGLFPHLTAEGNVALMARHLGWDSPRIEQRLQELCRLVQLPVDLLLRYPAEMSANAWASCGPSTRSCVINCRAICGPSSRNSVLE